MRKPMGVSNISLTGIYTEEGNGPITINIKGMFDNTDTFVKYFNEVMSNNATRIRMLYTAHLYEIRIQHHDGNNFTLEEYYDDGTFTELIGFNRLNQVVIFRPMLILQSFSHKDSYLFLCLNLEHIRLQRKGQIPHQNLILSVGKIH